MSDMDARIAAIADREARAIPDGLRKRLTDDCQRLVTGLCSTRACLIRGGYSGKGPVSYEIATCDARWLYQHLEHHYADIPWLLALVERQRKALERKNAALHDLMRLGEEGMKPEYSEWVTFHDAVARLARAALRETE